ncbi:hypothetical protein NDU88_001692 [Pleurodeles waltl]|uniref:Uncharacterized protein n=1 Tax=Pleurodeles waltl TaxID=8319 RepID=A0AAV7P7Y7_PLEWA|nr:hypothetical protein NDU88_001692 [Pleurodeles waltl]
MHAFALEAKGTVTGRCYNKRTRRAELGLTLPLPTRKRLQHHPIPCNFPGTEGKGSISLVATGEREEG